MKKNFGYIMGVLFFLVTILPLALGSVSGYTGPTLMDGHIEGTQVGTAIHIMKTVMNETAPAGRVYTNLNCGDCYVFVRALNDKIVWVGVNYGARGTLGYDSFVSGGNAANWKTAEDLFAEAEKNGWKMIPVSQVPQGLKLAVSGGQAWLTGMSVSFPTFIWVPGAALQIEDNPIIEGLEVTDG